MYNATLPECVGHSTRSTAAAAAQSAALVEPLPAFMSASMASTTKFIIIGETGPPHYVQPRLGQATGRPLLALQPRGHNLRSRSRHFTRIAGGSRLAAGSAARGPGAVGKVRCVCERPQAECGSLTSFRVAVQQGVPQKRVGTGTCATAAAAVVGGGHQRRQSVLARRVLC